MGFPQGSGSGKASLYRAALALPCTFCKPDEPLPVALRLALERPLTIGPETARNELNQHTLLIRSQHASEGCVWFSGRIDLDGDPDQSAFWVLEKTADTWDLYLKRVSYHAPWYLEWVPTEEVAWYACTAKECSYTQKLKLAWQNYGSKDFDWPPNVTIEAALP
jgi:hypothetical protein